MKHDMHYAEAAGKLYTAVVSDILDSMELRSQALSPHIRPLDDSLTMFGPARTGLYMDVYHSEAEGNPYELEMELIDDVKPGEAIILACSGSLRIAPWGELLTTAARARGSVGFVTDGLVRDVRMIREMAYPVFAGGIGPLDSKGRGRVMALDVPVELGGVLVNPGDWVLGDVDGLVVIPQDSIEEVIQKALAKASEENLVRDELAAGASLKEVFAKYRIL